MAKLMSKAGLIQAIADEHSDKLTRSDVKGVLESLARVGYKQLRKTGGVLGAWLCKVSRYQKARHQGTQRHQSLHKGANDFQGKVSSESSQSSPGKGWKGRYRIACRVLLRSGNSHETICQ